MSGAASTMAFRWMHGLRFPLILAMLAVPVTAAAQHHDGGRHHGGGAHWRFRGGGPYWGPAYWGWPYPWGWPYGVYDPPPVTYVYPPPPAVVLQPQSAPTGYWYYCGNPRGYYPHVQNCLTAWRPVPVTPPPP